jgi:hypothetical protein
MSPRAALFCAVMLSLAGCAIPERHPIPSVNEVVATSEQGGKFLSFVGPRRQFADPFYGVPNTNFFLLRSFIDTRSGEVAHQVFAEESYVGKERVWDTAFDAAGTKLRAIPISKNEITCQATCSYAEEFAAVVPEPLMRASTAKGLMVIFSDKAGDKLQITVPGELISKQLAAVDGTIATRPTAAASAPTAIPAAAPVEPIQPKTP